MQFVRYLVIQVLAYGLDMGGFVLLFSHFGVDPLLANVICKLLAGCLHSLLTAASPSEWWKLLGGCNRPCAILRCWH